VGTDLRHPSAAAGLAAALVAGALAGAPGCGSGAEGSAFECKCHESEDEANVRTMSVCAENEHAAIAAAKKCQGTASNAACTCEAVDGPCKQGGCR
jgi:hypothetical protein